MFDYIILFIPFMIALLLVLFIMPKVIPKLHELKFGQIEREEGPASHKKKQGTPTMGGVVFILAAIIGGCVFNYATINSPELWLIIFVLVGFGAIGFVDDYLIVAKKKNDGLPAWAKYLAQSVIAIAFYVLAEKFVPSFTSVVTIPLVKVDVDFGYLYPVLIYFMFTASSNGVNLSDGLDGLATGLCIIAIAPFTIFAVMTKNTVVASFSFAMIGALLGFLHFNYNPAKIFMGDVGALSLGGFLAVIAIFTKQELLLALIGAVFAMEALSVIIQVISFKTRGKRVFKMSPIHHHFEMIGWPEQQVVVSFWFAGFIVGILGIVLGVL